MTHTGANTSKGPFESAGRFKAMGHLPAGQLR